MKSTPRVWQCLVLLLLVLLAGCSKPWSTSTPEVDSIAYNPWLEDVSAGFASSAVSIKHLITDTMTNNYRYYGGYDNTAVTTHAFDSSVSGQQLDQLIINLKNYDLSYQSDQMQQSTNVTIRSISKCILNLTGNDITWATDTTWLQYHVKQLDLSGSTFTPLVDGETLSLGDQPVFAVTVKNTTANLIQFSGSNNCGPISPYWYARWYVVRSSVPSLLFSYWYKTYSWSTEIYRSGSFDMDSRNTTDTFSYMFEHQAFPIGTVITISVGTGYAYWTTWWVEWIGWATAMKFTDKAIIIDTSLFADESHKVVLKDNFGQRYNWWIDGYRTIRLTTVNVSAQSQEYGYYLGYQTQYPSLMIDAIATNKILSRNLSWVKIAESVGFDNCYSGDCFAFDIKIQSWQSIRIVTLSDWFGITGSVDLNFSMGAIKQSLKKATIRWEWINLLTMWRWDNAIQVDYTNISDTPINYYGCRWKPEAAIAKQLSRVWYESYGTKSARLEDLLFVCDDTAVIQTLKPSTNLYRTPKTSNLAVPQQLQNTKVFAVKTPYTANNAAQIFAQTQIGIYVKQSSNQATVWLFDLATGQPLTWSATLNLYQLSTVWRASSGTITVSKWPYITTTTTWWDLTALTAQVWDDRWFVTLGWKNNQTSYRSNDRSINLQSAIMVGDVTDGRTVPTWWSNPVSRIYAYTDRWLYKPGDQLFVAWWARNMTDIGSNTVTATGGISITLRKASDYNTILLQASWIKLDQYGGFNTSFVIPSTAWLDDYYLQVEDSNGAQYGQTLKINEYQKPTFYVDQTLAWSWSQYQVAIDPTYYFGSKLQSWSYTTDRSASTNSRWRWWWDMGNKSDYYYDTRLEYNNTSPGSSMRISGVGSTKPVRANLTRRDMLSSQPLTSKATTTIIDNLSNETQIISTYDDIKPLVSIGLQWSPYDRYYAKDIKTLKPIAWVSSGDVSQIARLEYHWYYYDWKSQQLNQWVDGSLYYNNTNYQEVQSGTLKWSSWSVPVSPVSKPGERLLIVQALDKNDREIWRNERSIWYADGDAYNYGSMNNNYTLTVSIDQKQYDEGQTLPINITPYINGAVVLITVEQWDRILDSYLRTLDGSQITVPVKATYYPSTIVSVLQVAWSDLINQANATKVRREPRMRQWYGQVKINQDLMKLNIDVTTDKQTYKPWDKVTLTVKTTDYKGKAVDARLSVGVVDKSLNDLYNYFKNPLSDFFMSLGTTITNYTNMKWIYQWLKVFTQEWGKGWGWWSRNPLWFLREKFDDVAYWRGWVYTKDGVWTTTFTLPDNLTTWTIDVVWVARSSKVGTTTTNIMATKDLIIQPNLPLYVTIGDRIDVPVKVLGITYQINKLKGENVILSGVVRTIDGIIISTIQSKTKLNSTIIIPITIDPSIYRYHDVVIELDGQIGNYRDYSIQTIPLRTNGLKQLMVKSSAGAQGSLSHTIPANSIDPQITLSLGQIPLISLNTTFDYMIHYPYGCAEQTISSAWFLLAAQQMTKYALFTGYFSGDMVMPLYDKPFSLTKAIDDAKTRVWWYQSSDGGFTYWGNDKTQYTLSAYIYGIMSRYPQLSRGYEWQISQLERYLDSNGGASNVDQYLYYLYYKSETRWWVNLTQVQQLIDADKTARVAPELLWAQIALNLGNRELALKWFNKLNIDDFDGEQSEYGSLYPLLTPRSALSFYQRLIMQLGGDKRDQMNDELIVALIRQKDSNGMWWYSTIDTMAALSIIAQYQQNHQTRPIACTITVDGKPQQITISSWSTHTMMIASSGSTKPLIEWKCDSSVIMDTKLDYGLLVPQTADLTRHNVEYLQWMIPSSGVKVGQTINAVAQFKITQPAPHTVVELYVPATLKLSDIVNKKESSSRNAPFTVEWNYNCQPSHYEVRFDRLFLYYDTLEANQSCRITIPAIVAYSGSTVSMSSKIWQMYDDSVYATQMPTIK